MKILIAGAQGMLGHDLVRGFQNYELVALDKEKFDITNKEQVLSKLRKIKPNIVINAAAFTNVDYCETNKKIALEINGNGPGILADACRQINAILVHYSTDYIFNGEKSNGYKEDFSVIKPINCYGESKAVGEKLIINRCQKYYILRTAWLYGKHGNNFVDTILKLSQTKKELKVVNDQFGCPTYTVDVANKTKEIIEMTKPNYGIYHIVNDGYCSWYDFAKKIIEIKKVNIVVKPCTSQEFPRPAKRPKYSILLNTKLSKLRSWTEALTEYLESETY